MAAYDFTKHRLHVPDDLREGGRLALDGQAATYLISVLRLPVGAEILVFNGREGEWRARLAETTKRHVSIELVARTRPQPSRADLVLMFAPLKHARLDYLVQKAVEMGAGALWPVLTRRTVPSRVNLERMQANAIEAAEQCGILAVPEIVPERPLDAALAALGPDRLLIACDEEAPVANPADALAGLSAEAGLAVLVGPEGGFDPAERAAILARPSVCRLSLGPRILRADTAIVAALAVVQATLGDWARPAALQGRGRVPM